MTVVEEQAPATAPAVAVPIARSPRPHWQRFLVFGSGVGIEVGARDLQAVIVRARANGVTVVAKLEIPDFHTRSPKEWGSEYHAWLRANGERHLSATVVLPRRESIVRQLALPGVSRKDAASAIGYQIDALHPYGEEDVVWGWSPAGAGAVLVGITRRSALESYAALFREAGVPVAGFTFSASAIYSALRLYPSTVREVLAWREEDHGSVEIYGENAAGRIFSAEFDLPPARALALARAELRMAGDESQPLAAAMPQPHNVVSVAPLALAAALASAGGWRTPFANLLPAEQRVVHSRARWIPTLVLGFVFLLAALALFIYNGIRDRRYTDELNALITQVQPMAARAAALDRRTEEHRHRIGLLDAYRKRTQGDVDLLAELSRLLPPPVWIQSIDITGDTVLIGGEADQAAPLLKVLDGSPLLQNSEFQMGVVRTKDGEQFRIRTQRRARK